MINKINKNGNNKKKKILNPEIVKSDNKATDELFYRK